MKKKVIRIFSFILSLIMLLSTFTVAFAKEKTDPIIMIHGLGAVPVYENANTSAKAEIANLGLGEAGDIVSKLLVKQGLLLEVVKILNPESKVSEKKLISELAKLVKDSKLNCDSNGNIPKGQGITDFYNDSLANHKDYWKNATTNENGIARQLCETAGAKNVYLFKYDWRQDVCTTAKDLNKFVQHVKKKTGAKKVTLVGCSLGGSVLSAYIDAYKSKKDVKRCVFVNPAFQGVDVASAFAKDLDITSEGVTNYIKNLQEVLFGGEYKKVIRTAYKLLDKRIVYAGDYLDKFLDNEKNVDELYTKVLKGWIGNIPSLWECIPYDCFDKAVSEMSKIGFLDKKSGLYKKITAYHKVQGRLDKNLKSLKKMGVDVAIFADYGTLGIPVTSRSKNNTDILIDTKRASAGATVANVGEKLKAKGKYVSSDKVIDAKTCSLPDNTWFIKNKQHMAFQFGSDAGKLLANVICGKVGCNIKAVKKKYGYNQFVKADSAQNLSNEL